MGALFTTQGKYEKALEYYKRALAGRGKSLGKGHPDTLCAVSSIARVFREQGKYDEALEWSRRALAGKEKTLGKGHPDTLLNILGIAIVPQNQGKYDKALERDTQALARGEEFLGKDDPVTLSAVNSMEELFQCQEKYDEALQWYDEQFSGERSPPRYAPHCPWYGKCLSGPGKVRQGTGAARASTRWAKEAPGRGPPSYALYCP